MESGGKALEIVHLEYEKCNEQVALKDEVGKAAVEDCVPGDDMLFSASGV